MNRLTTHEAEFLNGLNPFLKEGTDRQIIINLFRKTTSEVKKISQKQGREGWSVDQNWSDKDLM